MSDKNDFNVEMSGGLEAGGKAKYSHSHTSQRKSKRAFWIGLLVTAILAAIGLYVHPVAGFAIGVAGFFISYFVLPATVESHRETHHHGEE